MTTPSDLDDPLFDPEDDYDTDPPDFLHLFDDPERMTPDD